MPRARVNGISLCYETAGTGPPVLLIAGVGADKHFWYKQVPALSTWCRVIALDNRGAGDSDTPDEPYTLRLMAEDAAGLLDALEARATSVVGVSFGGFIAQELALAHPERVRRLVLCGTHFGGPNHAPMPAEALQAFLKRTGDPATDLRALLPVLFTAGYLREHTQEIEQEYVAHRVAHPQPVHAYQRQVVASLQHDTEGRLSELRLPALILHGAEDRAVPVRNAELLADRIRKSALHIFPDAGHMFLWERADEANRLIAEFLAGEQTADVG